jgi:hypothetical protein
MLPIRHYSSSVLGHESFFFVIAVIEILSLDLTKDFSALFKQNLFNLFFAIHIHFFFRVVVVGFSLSFLVDSNQLQQHVKSTFNLVFLAVT